MIFPRRTLTVFTVVPEVTDPAGLPDNPFWHAIVMFSLPRALPAVFTAQLKAFLEVFCRLLSAMVPNGPSPHTQGGRY